MKTILIVDDEPDVADVLAGALQDEGYRVIWASNGVEGLKCLRQGPVDLIVCDHMMPFMDGMTMCRQVRNDPEYRRRHIVIVSVMDEAAIKDEFTAYQGYLRKPFRRAALLDMVAALLEQKAARHERIG